MSTVQRGRDRGALRGDHWLMLLAKEFRTGRLMLGLSQATVAKAVRIPRSTFSLIERAKLVRLSVKLAAEIAAVLGLDLYIAAYPGPPGLRDEASAKLVQRLASTAGTPLRFRTEVPLPRRREQPEQRAWDGIFAGLGERTCTEIESRLYDAQAQLRRINLKRADDPADHFLLVVADTAHNRKVIADYPDLFADLPRLKTATVIETLRAGRHPPTGWMFLSALRPLPAPDQEERSTDGHDED